MQFITGEVVVYEEAQFPNGDGGACRFKGRHRDCAVTPEYSERLGGDALGGYKRYMPLCTPCADRRHGASALRKVRAEAGIPA